VKRGLVVAIGGAAIVIAGLVNENDRGHADRDQHQKSRRKQQDLADRGSARGVKRHSNLAYAKAKFERSPGREGFPGPPKRLFRQLVPWAPQCFAGAEAPFSRRAGPQDTVRASGCGSRHR